ncbi:aminoacylase-1-like [Arctopsyche grandis]|uniref:aminoacylase-1-like n=1 Tax=Arctopsyche grandis TaxID=121162 RepID=UPI00406D9C62
MSNWTGPEVNNFRKYLRIASVHPDINYDDCITFLTEQATELGLPIKVHVDNPKKPVVIITWEGKVPTSPSILLNSHMDVVPVFPESWTYPPFSAHLTEDGKIYARGSQDMKCVAIQYIETVRRLKKNGVRLNRTIHMCFVPDEEVGGVDGMRAFVQTEEFKKLNVGLAIDEGMASPTDEFLLYYGERSIWHLIITCNGNPGHGSLILPDTAGEKIRVVIDKFMDFRQKEKQRLEENQNLTVGDVTTVNLTQLSGGVQTNVVPESLTAVFDVRLAVDVNHAEFEAMVNSWCQEAGDNIKIEYEQKEDYVEITQLNENNAYWVAFKRAADDLNIKLSTRIFPGGTDSRFIRGVGLPAFGFSPMNRTPVLLHDHDEYLHADVYLKGIDIYEKLITAVANI